MPVDHPSLAEGWWQVERVDGLLRRWTDGDAVLPLQPAVRMVEIGLAGTMACRLASENLGLGPGRSS
jgi:hypothetical protein